MGHSTEERCPECEHKKTAHFVNELFDKLDSNHVRHYKSFCKVGGFTEEPCECSVPFVPIRRYCTHTATEFDGPCLGGDVRDKWPQWVNGRIVDKGG